MASGNLPAAFTTFVGRRYEVAEVRRRLGAARLLTLTGVGGVGKTRLALQVAGASNAAFAHGVWLVDLRPVPGLSSVADATAATLGVPDLGARPVLEQLAGFLARRRVLLVLDNCEHLVDECAELAQALLSAAPDVRILATSRETLGIVGEHVFTVPPMSPDEAVELLQDRTTAIRPDFRVTDANRTQVARLCADLDRLPLAIELAASRLRTLTVEQAVERLEDRFALLIAGGRTARTHQRTLRAAIDWSYELCVPAERLLWNRLSVFACGFGLDAVEQVCAGEGIVGEEVLDLLDRLVAQSVVLTITSERGPQYRLLETIREYGLERLVQSGEQQRLRRRHRDFYLALAEDFAARWCGPGQREGLARLHAERDNLRLALEFGDDPQATLRLAVALRFHWLAGGFLSEGRRQLSRALAVAPEPTPPRTAAVLLAVRMALLQGDSATADRSLDEEAELPGRSEDSLVRGEIRSLRGESALRRGQMSEALSCFEDAVAIHTAAGEPTELIVALASLTLAQVALRDPRAAETGCRDRCRGNVR